MRPDAVTAVRFPNPKYHRNDPGEHGTIEIEGPLPEGDPREMGAAPVEEKALILAVASAEPKVAAALQAENFAAAMRELSALRAPVDAFFEKVLVNSDNVSERENRLRLLAQVREVMGRVAEFGLVNS